MYNALRWRELGLDSGEELSRVLRIDRTNDWRMRQRFNMSTDGSAGTDVMDYEVQDLDVEILEGRFMLCGYRGKLCIFDLFEEGNTARSLKLSRSATRVRGVSRVLWYPEDTGLFLVGKSLANSNSNLQIWDTNALANISSYHVGRVSSISMSSCATTHSSVATCSELFGRAVCLLDLDSGAFTHRLEAHERPASVATFSPADEYMIASGAEDGTLCLWDIRRAGLSACVYRFDGTKVDLEDAGSVVGEHLAPNPSRKRIRRTRGPKAHGDGRIAGLSFTADGRYIISTGLSRVRTWDVLSGKCVCNFRVGRGSVPVSVTTTADPHFLYVTMARDIAVYEVLENEPLRILGREHVGDIHILQNNLAREELYSADLTGDLMVWTPEHLFSKVELVDAYDE